MEEIWKDISNYEGLYQISNLGNVKSLHYKKPKILKPFIANNYLKITLIKNGIKHKQYIHRLMAFEFLGLDKNSKLQVDHIDNNRLNNNIKNLQLLSQKDNIKKQMQNMILNVNKYKGNKIMQFINYYKED